MGRCYAMVLAGVVAGTFTAQDLVAQQPNGGRGEIPSIEPGERVRITTSPGSKPTVGWVDALEPRDVRVVEEVAHAVVTVPRNEIQRIERSRVRRSSTRRAAPGLTAGGLLGLVVGVAMTEEASCDPGASFCLDFPDKALGGMAGLGIGMLVGGLISWAIVPGESWEDATLPALTAGADTRGAYLSLRVPLGSGRRQ